MDERGDDSAKDAGIYSTMTMGVSRNSAQSTQSPFLTICVLYSTLCAEFVKKTQLFFWTRVYHCPFRGFDLHKQAEPGHASFELPPGSLGLGAQPVDDLRL